MDYKNFFLRVIFSIIFVFVYLIISFINFNLVFFLILFIYLLICIEVYLNFKIYRNIPLIYISISLIFFLLIDFNNNVIVNFNIFICIVILFDIFSYIIGNYFGKKQLIKISPNKTVEGFLGGFFISFLLTLLFAYLINVNLNIYLFIYITLIIISSFIGDIIESFFKRKNYLKNSSEFIPGHGGVFDRFDSFLFSIIFYSIFNNIYL